MVSSNEVSQRHITAPTIAVVFELFAQLEPFMDDYIARGCMAEPLTFMIGCGNWPLVLAHKPVKVIKID